VKKIVLANTITTEKVEPLRQDKKGTAELQDRNTLSERYILDVLIIDD
jgi:DNA repair protein RadC